MTNASRSAGEIVRDVIERSPVIRIGLAEGLINVRALARYIQTNTREDTTFEALVQAIRRFPIKEAAARRASVGKLIAKVGMKNKIVDVRIRNEPGMSEALARFSEQVDYGRGETLGIASSSRTVTVVLDSSNLGKLTKLIPKEKITNIVHDLATVTVTFAPEYDTTPGVLAAVTADFAIDRINLFDAFNSFPDVTFVIREEDALRALQAVKRLSEEK